MTQIASTSQYYSSLNIIHSTMNLSSSLRREVKILQIDMRTAKVSNWIINKFLEWQQNQGSLKSQAEFADYLGFEASTVSMWINGKHDPDPHSVRILATKLGLDIYDIMGLPQPPLAIHEIEASYENLSHSDRAEFEDDLDHWLGEWLKAHGFKRIK